MVDLEKILQSSIERISDPLVLSGVVIAAVAIYQGPAYIRAIGEVIRLGRLNKIKVERQKAALERELNAKKRLRTERKIDR